MTYTGTVVHYKDDSGEWRFRVRARNGRVVGPTESFSSARASRRGTDALRRALVNPRAIWLK